MLLMEMHTFHVSSITFLASESNAKDILGLQKKKINVTKPLRLETTKSYSRSNDIRTLDLLFSNGAQRHSDHGECPTATGTSAHDASVTGHPTTEKQQAAFCFLPTQQPGKIASCTILASILTQQA